MADFGFGKSKSKSKSRVQIPDFLQPFVNQVTTTAGDALGNLSQMQNQDLIANLTPQQLASLGIAQDRALGADGFIPTYQQQTMSTAGGRSVGDFLPAEAMAGLTGFNETGQSMIPPELLQQISGGAQLDPTSFATMQAMQSLGLPVGTDTLLGVDPSVPAGSLETLSRLSVPSTPSNAETVQSILEGEIIPGAASGAARAQLGQSPVSQDVLNQLMAGNIPSEASSAYSSLIGGQSAIPEATRQALEATASGDFLYGGEGFDRAIEAAMNRALPQIRSVFGSAGAGAATGGLAREAVGRAIGDTFASQYGQERGRQLSAAQALGQISQADAARLSQDTATGAGGLTNQAFNDAGIRFGAQQAAEGQNLARGQQSLTAADLMAQFGLADAGTRLGAQNQLESQILQGQQQQLGAASELGGLSLASRGQQLEGAQAAGGLDMANRGQQLAAAQQLAQLGLSADQISAATGLDAASLIGSLTSQERNRMLSGSQTLAGVSDSERQRQEQAIANLPGAATADADILARVGEILQQQQQQEINAPIGFQQMLLAAALSGIPMQSFLGKNTKGKASQATVGFEG